jgi:flavin-dependent dehydrogenase
VVIVLGGGPAGSAAARLLSLWGHRVLLLARPSTRPPFAESLPPSCRKLLDPLGVSPAMDAAGFVRTTGNTVWWGEAEARRHTFGADETGYQVRRDVLDALLLDAAAAAGVQVRRDAMVREVILAAGAMDSPRPDANPEIGGDPPAAALATHRDMPVAGSAIGAGPESQIPGEATTSIVSFDAGGQRLDSRASWIVDATGQAGLLARRGWRRAVPGPRTLALVGAWEKPPGWGLEDETHTLVESYRAGWAWSVPVSRTVRHFAVMIDPAKTPIEGRGNLEAAYLQELGGTRQFRRLLESATPIQGPWATDASAYDATCTAGPGVLLAGDAASFIDPLSSYGVKKALASGWLAAVVVNTCLRDRSLQAAALPFYDARERVMYESLTQQSVELAREAAHTHDHAFWRDRAAPGAFKDGAEPDVTALRGDADVLAAFQMIREAPSLRLRESARLTRIAKPVVRENRIVLMDHIAAPAFPEGIRYLRGVDLPFLVELASRFDQVPDLYEAYHRGAAPISLPDFLGALSVLIGKGLMERA